MQAEITQTLEKPIQVHGREVLRKTQNKLIHKMPTKKIHSLGDSLRANHKYNN